VADVLHIFYDTENDRAALYVNGKLERVGDTYLAHERAFEILGVRTEQDAAFYLGGPGTREPVAQTVDEIREFQTERDRSLAHAAGLRETAAHMVEQAAEIERKYRK
jgi:hypothetical protein